MPVLTARPEPAAIPIQGQIAELQRELALRRNVFPRLVREGRMKPSEADLCMARMEAALNTLHWVQDHRDSIVAAVKARKAGAA